MKKAIALATAFAMLATTSAFAGDLGGITGGAGIGLASPTMAPATSGNVIALDDLNVSIVADDYVGISQDDGFVYVYGMYDDSYPYVIIGEYDMSPEGFVDKFTDYMRGEYGDLDVDAVQEGLDVAGKTFDKVVYSYAVGDNVVRDVRLFTGLNGKTYMFGSKEAPGIGYVLPENYLENVAGSVAPLAGGDGDYEYHVDSEREVGPSGTPGGKQAETDVSTEVPTGGLGKVDASIGEEKTSSGGLFGNDFDDDDDDDFDDIDDDDDIDDFDEGSMTFSESMAPYAGTWCPFADGFRVYLPSTWKEFVVSDDQKALGCIYQAGPESALTNANDMHVAVNAIDVTGYGYDTTGDLASDLTACGYDVEEVVDLNGIEAVSYEMDSPKLHGVMFYGPKDKNMVFALVVYNGTDDMIGSILCSLSKYGA